jgi:radical SAM protein with 4Fe4S-binding SPASM domain
MLKPDPKLVVWEYTLMCDSKCIHCGSNAKIGRENELSSEEALDVVGQIADIGFELVVLSGGEPTLRKDWYKTAEKINEKMEFAIISNALAWKPDVIDKLASLNPYSIGFSVDGEQELHDHLRGAEGSHKKVFDAIRKLKRKKQTICVVTTINKTNLNALKAIRNRLIVYGVDAWQLQMASPMGRMADNKDLLVDDDEYYRLAEFIIETRERLPYMNVQAGDCMGYFGNLEEKIRDEGREWKGCMAGIETIGLESDGNVKACLSIRIPEAIVGNVRKIPLKEIWENPENFKYNRNFTLNDLKGDCKGCEYGAECRGGCESQSTAFFNEFHHAPYCFFKYEKKLAEKNATR